MRRATSSPADGGINTSLLGLALRWGLPGPVLPRERVVSYTAFSPLPLDPAFGGTRGGLFSVALSVSYEPTSYVAPCPEPYSSGFALESSDFPPRFSSLLGQGFNPCSNLFENRGDHLFCSGNFNSSF
jgi:hypothetical protein